MEINRKKIQRRWIMGALLMMRGVRCGIWVKYWTKEEALAAMSYNFMALQYTSEALRKDRDFMIAALKKDGTSFMFVPHHLII